MANFLLFLPEFHPVKKTLDKKSLATTYRPTKYHNIQSPKLFNKQAIEA